MELTPKKVIVVDDEPDTAEMFAEMMRLSGFEVLKCYGAKSAITLIDEKQPNAVVLDVMMPDASGFEVLRYMRAQEQFSATPVIVVSARTLSADIRQALEAGASVYLTKPVAFQDLKRAVDHALQPEEAH